ncbi:MAG: formate dehydrogenase subunit delta [Gemmatimonadaceae bacterium]|nr:formate dehydrogenase subunit delta [Gemmatimonadaceae bacterium]
MRPDDLARMANQIAQYFSAYPDPESVDGVRDHLQKFWDPQMRRDLLAIADRHAAAGEGAIALHPLVVRALRPPGADTSS